MVLPGISLYRLVYLLPLNGITWYCIVLYCVVGFGARAVSRKTPISFISLVCLQNVPFCKCNSLRLMVKGNMNFLSSCLFPCPSFSLLAVACVMFIEAEFLGLLPMSSFHKCRRN